MAVLPKLINLETVQIGEFRSCKHTKNEGFIPALGRHNDRKVHQS
jgi:hypothetical protein